MNCSHVPDNRICEPCTRAEYVHFAGPVHDWREGDRAFHKVYRKILTIAKIMGHGSVIMTAEGITVSLGNLEPVTESQKGEGLDGSGS